MTDSKSFPDRIRRLSIQVGAMVAYATRTANRWETMTMNKESIDQPFVDELAAGIEELISTYSDVVTEWHSLKTAFTLANIRLSMAAGKSPLISHADGAKASWHAYAIAFANMIRVDVCDDLGLDLRTVSQTAQSCVALNRNNECRDMITSALLSRQPLLSAIGDPLPEELGIWALLEIEATLAATLENEPGVQWQKPRAAGIEDALDETTRPRKQRQMSPTDKRNRWVYEKLSDVQTKAPEVLEKLKRIAPERNWRTVGSIQALYQAAASYAEKYGKKPLPVRRQKVARHRN